MQTRIEKNRMKVLYCRFSQLNPLEQMILEKKMLLFWFVRVYRISFHSLILWRKSYIQTCLPRLLCFWCSSDAVISFLPENWNFDAEISGITRSRCLITQTYRFSVSNWTSITFYWPVLSSNLYYLSQGFVFQLC